MKQTLSIRRTRLIPTVGLLLILGSLVLAFFFFSSSPANAALFATLTPTQAPVLIDGCTPVENVSSADVGKTMCVTGRVFKVKQTTNQGLNVFSVQLIDSEGFLFVSYDRTWQVSENACVFATGEVRALGSSTIILLGYKVPLEFCSP